MKQWKAIMIGAAMLGLITPAFAQVDTKASQQKLLAKRAAEADAYRKLAECIKGFQINSDTYVKDFVAESDQIRTSLDTFIRAVRLGNAQFFDDGSCQVEAEVTVAKVIETLETTYATHYKGNKIKKNEFQNIKTYVKKDIIKVIGSGAPREDLPPDLPDGAFKQASLPTPAIPDLWRKIGPRARLMAEKAAEVDAQRKLLERIIGLRINSETIVRDFVAESDVIQTAASGKLIGARKVRTYYHHDEPICEVTVEVPVESVISTIQEMHSKSVRGNDIKGLDITQVKQSIATQTFQATGMGIPPDQYLKQYNQKVDAAAQIPDWAMNPIRMTGSGVPPADRKGSPQGKLMAARAAELDAKRKLGEHINGLAISSNTLVKDFVAEHDDIQSQMQAVLVGSSVEKTVYVGDDTAQVTVVIPGMRVWETISVYTRTVAVAPAPSATPVMAAPAQADPNQPPPPAAPPIESSY